jgi:hypothetical protein
MAIFYALQVLADNLNATVRLNDVVIAQQSAYGKLASVDPVNMWLGGTEGVVKVTLVWPSGAAAERAHLEVIVFRTTRSDQPTNQGEKVAELRLPSTEHSQDRPSEISVQFKVDPVPPAQLWTAAESLTLDAATQAGAVAHLQELQHALERHDMSRAAQLLDWKTVDVASAMYMQSGESRAGLHDFLDFVMTAPGFKLKPIEAAQLDFRLEAKGRLLSVTRRSGGAAITTVPGVNPGLELPVYLARVSGQWHIVR